MGVAPKTLDASFHGTSQTKRMIRKLGGTSYGKSPSDRQVRCTGVNWSRHWIGCQRSRAAICCSAAKNRDDVWFSENMGHKVIITLIAAPYLFLGRGKNMLIIIFTFIFTMKLAISGYTISKFETPGVWTSRHRNSGAVWDDWEKPRVPTWWRTTHGHRGKVGEPTLVISMGCLWGLGMSTKISGVNCPPPKRFVGSSPPSMVQRFVFSEVKRAISCRIHQSWIKFLKWVGSVTWLLMRS